MKLVKRLSTYLVLLIGAVAFIYPFYWMIGASVAPENEIAGFTFWPSSIIRYLSAGLFLIASLSLLP